MDPHVSQKDSHNVVGEGWQPTKRQRTFLLSPPMVCNCCAWTPTQYPILIS